MGLTFKKNYVKVFRKVIFLLVLVKVFAVGSICISCISCVSSFHQGQNSKVWLETWDEKQRSLSMVVLLLDIPDSVVNLRAEFCNRSYAGCWILGLETAVSSWFHLWYSYEVFKRLPNIFFMSNSSTMCCGIREEWKNI